MDDKLITISGVRGYIDEKGVAYVNLEDISRGLGFVQVQRSGNPTIRWDRVRCYLADVTAPKVGCNDTNSQLELPEFIP